MRLSNKAKVRLILILLGFVGLFTYYYHLNKNKEPSLEDTFVDRLLSIEKFKNSSEFDSSNQKIAEGKTSQGSEEVFLTNKAQFIEKAPNLDSALSVIAAITNGLNYSSIISEDIASVEHEQYFEKNKDTIIDLYGVTTFEDFNVIATKFIEAYPISEYEIDLNTLKIENEKYTFDIVLNKEKDTRIPVVVIVLDSYNMKYSILWNVR